MFFYYNLNEYYELNIAKIVAIIKKMLYRSFINASPNLVGTKTSYEATIAIGSTAYSPYFLKTDSTCDFDRSTDNRIRLSKTFNCRQFRENQKFVILV